MEPTADADDVEFGVQRVGRSSLTTLELLRADEKPAARALVSVVMWDRVAGRKRLLTDDERDRADRVYVASQPSESQRA